jgi:hypothetical protein
MKPGHPFDSQAKKGGSHRAACFRSHVVVVVMIPPVIVVIPMVVVIPVIMVVMPVVMMIPVIGERDACSANQSRQREQNGNC